MASKSVLVEKLRNKEWNKVEGSLNYFEGMSAYEFETAVKVKKGIKI